MKYKISKETYKSLERIQNSLMGNIIEDNLEDVILYLDMLLSKAREIKNYVAETDSGFY